VCFLGTSFLSRIALAAENLFLRKQLALYRERRVKRRRASDPLRLTLGLLARCSAGTETPFDSCGAGDRGLAGRGSRASSSG
jgi:hypothetical protein